MANAAQFERRLIGQRTREALAAKKAAGVRLGRPAVLPREVVERIVRERRDGASIRAIAAGLTADQVPTARGGLAWSGSGPVGSGRPRRRSRHELMRMFLARSPIHNLVAST